MKKQISVKRIAKNLTRFVFIAALAAGAAGLCFAQQTATFSNAAPITIPTTGAGSPYPSAIFVSGMTGYVTDVNVTINNLQHNQPNDIALLLVSPDGKKVLIQSNAGGTTAVSNVTYTIDDQATNFFPSPITSGTFLPYLGGGFGGSFPAPAPPAPYLSPNGIPGSSMNNFFLGSVPNGTWSLYVWDFESGFNGAINGGWAITIRTRTTIKDIPFDFDDDTRADISVFRPSDGVWHLLQSQNGYTAFAFGLNGDKPVPGDYDGDGRTDAAIFRLGVWHLLRSTLGYTALQFGLSDDVPVPGDYDGDGLTDIAVFRASSGVWHILQSSLGYKSFQWGQPGDKPNPADFTGDRRMDLVVFRPGNRSWYGYNLSAHFGQLFTGIPFGQSGSKPVAGDYNGDGLAEIAVFQDGVWYVRYGTFTSTTTQFGLSGDTPVPADFDGDNKIDLSVFRPANGIWYILNSANGQTTTTILQFGFGSDLPIPSVFVP